MYRIFLIGLFLFSTFNALSQAWKTLDDDALFHAARSNAFAHNYSEAQDMLNALLDKNPRHNDARLLLGRMFLWQKDYEKAKMNFLRVLEFDESNIEGLLALSDTEFAVGKYAAAREPALKAVRLSPASEEVLFKFAACSHAVKDDEQALQTLSQLLVINPSHEQGRSLAKNIRSARYKNTFGVTYGIDVFSRAYDPAHFGSLQFSRINSWGNSIMRLNYANRFDLRAVQPEIDVYPKLTKHLYAFVNYAYSSDALFPTHKTGAEVFAKLPRGFEASAGGRYLVFRRLRDVTLLTGSVGYYGRNTWFSVRPYIALTGTTSSLTLIFNARRYLSDADSFIGVYGGFGYSPDMTRIQSSTGLTDTDIFLLKSQRGGVVFQKLVGSLIVNLAAELSQQELLFDRGNYVTIVSASAGIRKKF